MSETKVCTKCVQEKELNEFIRDKRFRSGRSARCKECSRAYAAMLRKEDPDKVQGYRRKYSRNHCDRVYASISKYYEANPEKRKAHAAVRRALKSGKLEKQPCEVCGTTEDLHAHHEDYNKPLDIIWLCRSHHAEHHRIN